jgi:membrane protein implicated in regulation of membrane protease activity
MLRRATDIVIAGVPSAFLLAIPCWLFAQVGPPAAVPANSTMQDLLTEHYVSLAMWVASGVFLLSLGWRVRSYIGKQAGNRTKLINRMRAIEAKLKIDPPNVDRIDESED